ncbi:hypothetical protein BH20ACI2_BH20ACI2_21370 [soil metagenome]
MSEKLLKLVREKRNQWENDENVRSSIAELRLIKCLDGQYHAGSTVYLDTQDNRDALGDGFPFVSSETDKDFLMLIGVSEYPKVGDLLNIIRKTVKSGDPDERNVSAVVRVMRHIGKRWKEFEDSKEIARFDDLKNEAWLPEMGKAVNWCKPAELWSPEKRHLFSSVGTFVNIEVDKSEPGVFRFLKYLEVRVEPEVKQVVQHLQNYASENKKIDVRVYDFLNKHYDNQAVEILKGTPCIRDESNNRYIRPSKCFWDEVPFGRYRFKLPETHRKYEKLFTRWGVSKSPIFNDAVDVLREISEQFSLENGELDDESKKVVFQCWLFLKDAESPIIKNVSEFASIVNEACHLEFPRCLFFDNFSGIAEYLGLEPNVLPIKPDIFKPMLVAGVRFLSEVLNVEIIECPDSREDVVLEEKLGWKSCFERAISKYIKRDNSDNSDLDILKELKLFSVPELTVRYSVEELERKSEEVPAFSAYDRAEGKVYFKHPSLTYLSREVARAILPSADGTELAAYIGYILTAKSLTEAHNELDGLGLPKVDVSEFESPISSELIDFRDNLSHTDRTHDERD